MANSPQLSKISIANLTLEENKELENPNLYRKRRWDEFTLVAAAAVAIPAEHYTEEHLAEKPWGSSVSASSSTPSVYQTSPAMKIASNSVAISPSPSPTSGSAPAETTFITRYRSNSFCSSNSSSPSPSPYPSPPASPKKRSLGKSSSAKSLLQPKTTPKKRAPLSNRTMKLDINFEEENEMEVDDDDEDFDEEDGDKKEANGRKYGRKDLSYLLTTPIDLKTYLAAWLARHTTIETNGCADPIYHCWKCVPPKGTAASSPQRTTAYIRIAVPRHLRAPGLPGKYQAHHVHAMNLGMLPSDPLKMVASRRCGHLWCVAPHHLVWETISENFLRERSGKCVGGDRCAHGPLKCFAFPK